MNITQFNPDILVPMTLLVVALFAFRAWLVHRDQGRKALQQTLRAAIDGGAELPAEVWSRLVAAVDPKRLDLRRAIVFGVLAIVVAALGWLLPLQDPAGRQAFLAVAVLPAALGLMHLVFWRFWHRG